MRPDRIVLGECRGAEVREVLTALNTGHDGGCATVHANAAADVPARLEALAALAGMSPRRRARRRPRARSTRCCTCAGPAPTGPAVRRRGRRRAAGCAGGLEVRRALAADPAGATVRAGRGGPRSPTRLGLAGGARRRVGRRGERAGRSLLRRGRRRRGGAPAAAPVGVRGRSTAARAGVRGRAPDLSAVLLAAAAQLRAGATPGRRVGAGRSGEPAAARCRPGALLAASPAGRGRDCAARVARPTSAGA